jgi:hypothetical protein
MTNKRFLPEAPRPLTQEELKRIDLKIQKLIAERKKAK